MPGVRARLRTIKPEVAALRRDTLGTKLKRRRLEQGLRQKDVAPRLSITHKTLVNWERDHTTPDVAYYPAIITFLGVEPWPEPKALAEKLRAERHRRGWSIAQSAAHLGVDEGTFGGWERGKRRPTRSSRSICYRFLREGQ